MKNEPAPGMPAFTYRIRGLKMELSPEFSPQGALRARVTVNGLVQTYSDDPKYSQSYPTETMAFEWPVQESDFVASSDQFFSMMAEAFKQYIRANDPKPIWDKGPIPNPPRRP